MGLPVSPRSLVFRCVSGTAEMWQRVFAAWHEFWFQPIDPLMIGIIRLLTGWMLLYNLLVWSIDLPAFFSDDGMQPLATIRSLHAGDPIFSFWLWTGDTWLWPMHWSCVAIATMFCLGFASRITSILSFLITISYSQRVPVANFGFDQILGFLCLYLSLAPSGAAMSLDAVIRRWWRKRRGLETPVVPSSSAKMVSRLIQLHLCAIYLWAGFSKLKGPSWWTGEAMWRVLANQEYQTMDLTWMAQVPWLPYLIAHITIAWEVSFIVLVWNPRFRPLMLLMGVLMHLGIGAFLGMWTFGLIMAFAYFSFSNPAVWRLSLNSLLNVRRESDLPQHETAARCHSKGESDPSINRHTVTDVSRDGIRVADLSMAAAAVLDPCEEFVNDFLEHNFDSVADRPAASEDVGATSTDRVSAIGLSPEKLQSDRHVHNNVVDAVTEWNGPDTGSPVCSMAGPATDEQQRKQDINMRGMNNAWSAAGDTPSAKSLSICVIAESTSERSALRHYLRAHECSCLAVPDCHSALTAISRNRFDAVLIHGKGLSSNDILSVCEDVADLAGLPSIVLLCAAQNPVIDHLSRVPRVSWATLPVSLKDIRSRLAAAMDAHRRATVESISASGSH